MPVPKKLIVFLLIGISLFLFLIKLIHKADTMSFFVDEVINNQAVYNLFTIGDYTSRIQHEKFDPAITSGILTTWLSGVVFLNGGNLFQSRLIIAVFMFFQMLVLGVLFMKKYIKPLPERIIFSLISIFALFYFPYWYGFIYNLGELQGALLLGWGLLILNRFPPLAYFMLGGAVWLCKMIYLPCAILWGAASALSTPGVLSRKAKSGILFLFFFFFPLFFWMMLIYLKFDWSVLKAWFIQFTHFFHGHSGLDRALTLSERLHTMEWANLKFHTKFEIIFFLIFPVIYGIYVLLREISWGEERPKFLLVLATMGFLILHTYWYFFISGFMWARHAQPGLYIGFGLLCFLLLQTKLFFSHNSFLYLPRILFVLFCIVLFFQILTFKKSWPTISKTATFARLCVDLNSDQCLGH